MIVERLSKFAHNGPPAGSAESRITPATTCARRRTARFGYYSEIAVGGPKLSLAPAVNPKETKVLHRDFVPEHARDAVT